MGFFGTRRFATRTKNSGYADRRVGVVVRVRADASPAEVFAAALPEVLAGRVTVSHGIGRPPGSRARNRVVSRDYAEDFVAASQQQGARSASVVSSTRSPAAQPGRPQGGDQGVPRRTQAQRRLPTYPGMDALEGAAQERIRRIPQTMIKPRAIPGNLGRGVQGRVQLRKIINAPRGLEALARERLLDIPKGASAAERQRVRIEVRDLIKEIQRQASLPIGSLLPAVIPR